MRFVLSLLLMLTFGLQADAQIFKRGTQYYSCQNGSCTKIAPPANPLNVPELPLGTKGVGEDFPTGVNPEGIEQGHSINGVKATKAEVYSAVETALPELSKKWRLVVVGTMDQRKEALAKIGTKDSVVVNVFPPDHFYVKDMKPDKLITLMRPDGEVVADGGLADVDKVMDFTKVGPFDPQPKPPIPKVPDPAPPTPDPTPPPAPAPAVPWYANIWHYIWAAGGVLLTIFARYGFPLIAGFLTTKLGPDAEAKIQALVDEVAALRSKTNSYAPVSLPDVPQPATPVAGGNGWK